MLAITRNHGETVCLTDTQEDTVWLTVRRDMGFPDAVWLEIEYPPEGTQRDQNVRLLEGEHHKLRMPDGEQVRIVHHGCPKPHSVILRFEAKRGVAILRGELGQLDRTLLDKKASRVV